MNQLERHIEILLLSNDCVIVPDLGGFVAHHICARYVPEEGLFLPPLRTLGFNPQLTLNDSLLAQSYAEALDISLPEALDTIEHEVGVLKAVLADEGHAELNDLGTLFMDADGLITFEPFEAGILTPSLYALSSFEIKEISQSAQDDAQTLALPQKPQTESLAIDSVPAGKAELIEEEASQNDGEPSPAVYIAEDKKGHKTINISLRALRNIAAAAAVIVAMFLITPPLNQGHTNPMQGIKSSVLCSLMPSIEQVIRPAQDTTHVVIKKPKPQTTPQKFDKTKQLSTAHQQKVAVQPTSQSKMPEPQNISIGVQNISIGVQNKSAELQDKPVNLQNTPKEFQTTAQQASSSHWSIVLCSHVSQQGAEMFVQKIQKEGVNGAQVSNASGTTKVLYGNYKTAQEAQTALNMLRSKPNFKQAWVLEVK